MYSLHRHASSIPGNLTNNSDRLRCSPSSRDRPLRRSLPPRNHYGYHYFRSNDERHENERDDVKVYDRAGERGGGGIERKTGRRKKEEERERERDLPATIGLSNIQRRRENSLLTPGDSVHLPRCLAATARERASFFLPVYAILFLRFLEIWDFLQASDARIVGVRSVCNGVECQSA